MKNLTLLTLFFAFFITTIIHAQISTVKPDRACINCPTDEPDASAVIEIIASDKGILIPRVANTAAVSSLTTGLLIYDNSDNTFKYYNGTHWVTFGGNLQTTVLGNGNTATGGRSTALGRTNDATGEESLAAGFLNEAIGVRSTAVGNRNDAMDENSTALGYANEATGVESTAVGNRNDATGMRSTAVGAVNDAIGNESTAVGYQNEATTFGSTAVGYNNDATGGNATAYGFQNTASGGVSVAIGYNSLASATSAIAIGNRDTVTSNNSLAIGILNKSSGNSNTSIGNRNTTIALGSTAIGRENTASSEDAIAVGNENEASGSGASAFGYQNEVSDAFSGAFGHFNIVTSDSSSAVGFRNEASGGFSSAFGYKNEVIGNHSNAFGYQNEVSDAFGGAFGHFNVVMGDSSSAVGYKNQTTGRENTAVGYLNETDGTGSSAVGAENQAIVVGSSAFGYNNQANGSESSAFGYSSIATATGSSAFGQFSTASAFNSVAVGQATFASGDFSSAFGNSISAPLFRMTAIGTYNAVPSGSSTTWVATQPVFMVGNGENSANRSTALTILKNGNTGIGTTTPTDAPFIVESNEYDNAIEENIGVFRRSANSYANIKMIANGHAGIKFVDEGSGSVGETDFMIKLSGSGDLDILSADNADDEFIFNDQIARFETLADTYQFTVYGDALASGGTWTNSDRRLKKNIKDLDNPLEKLLQLQPKQYYFDHSNSKFQYLNLPAETQIGLIAQEVEKVFPELVKTDRATPNTDKDEKPDENAAKEIEDLKAVNYTALIPVLIGAVQEQQSQLENKDKAIEYLKNQNATLDNRLTKIEAQLAQLSSSQTTKIQLENNTFPNQQPQLQQNQPNPFSDHTVIPYYIPETVQQAQLQFQDLNGKVLNVITIAHFGQGQIELETAALVSGTYSYSLVLDGQIFATKRMVLSR